MPSARNALHFALPDPAPYPPSLSQEEAHLKKHPADPHTELVHSVFNMKDSVDQMTGVSYVCSLILCHPSRLPPRRREQK